MTKGKFPYYKFGFSLIGVLLAIALQATPLYAQLTRGAISGTINDTTGAVIAGATVKVTNVGTNQTRTTTTNNEGFYRFAAVEPGTYDIVVEKEGFAGAKVRSVVVRTSQEVTFDTKLNVGSTSETVDVSAQAEAIALNKSNPTIGLTVTGRQAVDLPLSGIGTGDRNINNLALLSPNAFRAPGSTQISVNGQRARNNNFTIDGSDNNDISITVSTTSIIPESVAEFQIQTNSYNAEFGRNSGAQINVITKSGTNQYHGDVWEYYRGSALSALSNADKDAGFTETPRFNRNQLGFDFGGPIIKDRTFFFGVLQADRERTGSQPSTTSVTIPTQAGFAALQGVSLRDGQSAASRQAVLDSISFLNDVYALNPTFTNVTDPTCTEGPGCSPGVNGTAIQVGATRLPISQPNNTWTWLFRGDHKFREGDNFTARYSYDKPVDVNIASNLGFGSLFAGNQNVLDQNLALSETHVFTPSILNEFRFSYIRSNLQFPENDPTTPTATITSLFTVGGAATFPQGRVQNSFQWSDILSWQKNRHALKFGMDIRRIRLFNLAAFNSKGAFTFNNLQDYMNNSAAIFRQALQTATFDARQTQQSYFAQDNFHVTPSLTLNLGLRYEYSKVPFGAFGATDPESLAALVPGPVKTDKNNFAPVVGFSYSPRAGKGFLGKALGDGKTVFRGGYRMAYDILFYNILVVNASNYPRVIVGEQFNVLDTYPNLLPVSGSPVFNAMAAYANTPEDARTPYSQLYSFTIQREMYRDFILEFGYTGSRSLNQVNQLQANPSILTPEQIAAVRANIDAGNEDLNMGIPDPEDRRLFPQFGSRTLIATTAQASYNAGFISLNKRMSRGLQFGLAYTYSKNISNNDESLNVVGLSSSSPQVPQDFFNYGAERGPSAFDRTHRFVADYIYEVPSIKASWAQKPVIKQVFDGWQIGGITAFQSGQPFTIITGVDSNGNGTPTGDRPMFNPAGVFTVDPLTGNLRTFTTSKADGRYLVPLSGGNPVPNSLGNGNLGRNTLRAPGFWNTDLSIAKRFKLFESHSLVFRVDFLNAFNQDNYGVPVNSLNSPIFGQNTNDWGNRSITLGAKYTF